MKALVTLPWKVLGTITHLRKGGVTCFDVDYSLSGMIDFNGHSHICQIRRTMKDQITISLAENSDELSHSFADNSLKITSGIQLTIVQLSSKGKRCPAVVGDYGNKKGNKSTCSQAVVDENISSVADKNKIEIPDKNTHSGDKHVEKSPLFVMQPPEDHTKDTVGVCTRAKKTLNRICEMENSMSVEPVSESGQCNNSESTTININEAESLVELDIVGDDQAILQKDVIEDDGTENTDGVVSNDEPIKESVTAESTLHPIENGTSQSTIAQSSIIEAFNISELCELCSHNFKKYSDLHQHIKTYHKKDSKKQEYLTKLKKTSEMQCSACSKILAGYNRFLFHKRTAHTQENIQIECPVCLNFYKNKHLFREHLIKTHKLKNNKIIEIFKKLCIELSASQRGISKQSTNDKDDFTENDQGFPEAEGEERMDIKKGISVGNKLDHKGLNIDATASESGKGKFVGSSTSVISDIRVEPNIELIDLLNASNEPERLFSDQLRFRCPFCRKIQRARCVLQHLNKYHFLEDTLPFYRTQVTRFVKCKCPHCDKILGNPTSLGSHIKDVHLQDNTPQTCPKCNKGLPNAVSLKNHLKRTCNIKRNLVCHQCAKEFKTQNGLVQHLKYQHNPSNRERKYKCPHCPALFFKEANLNKHVRGHLGQRPFVCDICLNAYTAMDVLLKHKKAAHSGLGPYPCPTCHKKFAREETLKQHYQVMHKKRTKHICSECNALFRTASNLKEHVDGVHLKLREHVCSLCPSAFTRRRAMLAHMLRVHNAKPIEFEDVKNLAQMEDDSGDVVFSTLTEATAADTSVKPESLAVLTALQTDQDQISVIEIRQEDYHPEVSIEEMKIEENYTSAESVLTSASDGVRVITVAREDVIQNLQQADSTGVASHETVVDTFNQNLECGQIEVGQNVIGEREVEHHIEDAELIMALAGMKSDDHVAKVITDEHGNELIILEPKCNEVLVKSDTDLSL